MEKLSKIDSAERELVMNQEAIKLEQFSYDPGLFLEQYKAEIESTVGTPEIISMMVIEEAIRCTRLLRDSADNPQHELVRTLSECGLGSEEGELAFFQILRSVGVASEYVKAWITDAAATSYLSDEEKRDLELSYKNIDIAYGDE